MGDLLSKTKRLSPETQANASNGITVLNSKNVTLNQIYDAHLHHSEHLENIESKLNAAIIVIVLLVVLIIIMCAYKGCSKFKVVKKQAEEA